ncbi:TauD/TfdA dioxygenase family protein [Roseomonas xinghualingensis]|uniref:TauD/TfdA dioxygenase family protein n=1 Tax=Roseomonas xinghualingensis TaxID=2986475 RepID=UPI0021F10781|nr:TauD/TfdA family dioxygenase [Roseomonas sp. SXEYE001]MCV4210221.1 TauD/TfdA family dioxygenase [Roseomonas sp. SXEYE001]
MPLDTASPITYSGGVTAIPTGGALAADVVGLDLSRPLPPEAIAGIRQAWGDHLVLRFRGQSLNDDALTAFSAHFGRLDRAPIAAAKRGEDQQPGYVLLISNIVENGRAIGGLGDGESVWHTDMSYADEPPYASCLYAVEVPPAGGNTGYANMYRAYETLPDDLKAFAEAHRCKHDASRNSAGELRRGFNEADGPREVPGAVHPLVIRHPATGRRALYLGRRRNAYIPGLSLEESERRLDALWAHATRPEFAWAQEWRVGDVIMWDNFSTMHRRDAFDPATRRLLRRTQVSGMRYEAA